MDSTQKQELVDRIEEHGVHKLFMDLGFKNVSRKGDNVYCTCPFHENADNPTGFAYSNKFGYCFTRCHKYMDIFSIVMEARQCDFSEAVSYLSELIGMDVSYSYTQKVDFDGAVNREFLSQLRRIKSKKIVEPKPFNPNILNDFVPALHTKLRGEGFDEAVRSYFGLGFSQSGYLENRITIPIDYIDSSIITVSGRSVLPDKELEEMGIKRYLIWFETDKSVTLYNISRALPYIELVREVIVVEGFKSVWRLHQWGYRNAVALMGSSMSEAQRDMLLKLNCDIVICGDRDSAGSKLNKQVYDECSKYADTEIMDMYLLDGISYKSSIDDITKSQFEFIYNNRK